MPTARKIASDGPKTRARRNSYNESANEPGKLLDEEAVEIEHETPSEETDPIEEFRAGDKPTPPAFEE
ncbi:MAG: hypothetical protein QOK29_3013 [Rhodospirillaceae bacterium]|nr:hypothetical protein [Rhodospirillaceae bacterium]